MHALTLLLLAANLCQAGKIFDFFWADASRAAYTVQLGIVALFMIVALYRGDLLVLAMGVGLSAILVSSQLVFSLNTGGAVNMNAIVTYAPLLTFVVFYHLDLGIFQVVRMMAWLCTGYVLIYLVLSGYILAVDPAAAVVLPGHDDESQGRVFLAASYAAFVAFYGLRAAELNFGLRCALIGLGVYALIVCDARTYLAIVVGLLLLGGAGLFGRGTRFLLLVATLGGVALILGGVVVPDWNPFGFGTDDSAIYRAHEYRYAVHAIRDHWLLGVGTASDSATLQTYLHTPMYEPLFPSDLGAIAPFFQFGVLGLIAFLAVIVFSLGARLYNSGPEVEALLLVCGANAVVGIISPLALLEPSSIFVMLLLAMWMRQRRMEARRRVPLFAHVAALAV